MPRNHKKWAGGLELHTRLARLAVKLRCGCCGRLPPAKDFLGWLPEHLKRDPRTVRAHLAEIAKTLDQLEREV